ncbi:MAG: hypothetical protein ACPGWR_09695 [Ardenticatenaceae bacterium]
MDKTMTCRGVAGVGCSINNQLVKTALITPQSTSRLARIDPPMTPQRYCIARQRPINDLAWPNDDHSTTGEATNRPLLRLVVLTNRSSIQPPSPA